MKSCQAEVELGNVIFLHLAKGFFERRLRLRISSGVVFRASDIGPYAPGWRNLTADETRIALGHAVEIRSRIVGLAAQQSLTSGEELAASPQAGACHKKQRHDAQASQA